MDFLISLVPAKHPPTSSSRDFVYMLPIIEIYPVYSHVADPTNVCMEVEDWSSSVSYALLLLSALSAEWGKLLLRSGKSSSATENLISTGFYWYQICSSLPHGCQVLIWKALEALNGHASDGAASKCHDRFSLVSENLSSIASFHSPVLQSNTSIFSLERCSLCRRLEGRLSPPCKPNP